MSRLQNPFYLPDSPFREYVLALHTIYVFLHILAGILDDEPLHSLIVDYN